MNDLHDALRKAISDYMNADKLAPRHKMRLMDAHAKYSYDYDTVDSLLVMDMEESEDER
jgi:hypothetical protein